MQTRCRIFAESLTILSVSLFMRVEHVVQWLDLFYLQIEVHWHSKHCFEVTINSNWTGVELWCPLPHFNTATWELYLNNPEHPKGPYGQDGNFSFCVTGPAQAFRLLETGSAAENLLCSLCCVTHLFDQPGTQRAPPRARILLRQKCVKLSGSTGLRGLYSVRAFVSQVTFCLVLFQEAKKVMMAVEQHP